MEVKENERIDDLEYNGLKIIQNKDGFCFGMDSVLLSDFAKDIKKDANVLDLGTGTGILPILLCGKTNLKKIIGVEIQKEVADMASRSSALNNLENRFEVINCNILELEEKFQKGSFDAVITNPPYKKDKTGKINENEIKKISRHEITANLKDFIQVSSKMLKNNGALYMVHRPERLSEIITLFKEFNIEPKVLKLVQPNLEKNPNLVLIKGVKCGKTFLKTEKTLIVYNKDGTYTNEILKIYNKL